MDIKGMFKVPELTTKQSVGLLLLRVLAGVAFMMHGWGKIQTPMEWMGPGAPVPGVFQFLAAFSEFFGGLAWILGLLFPLASLGLAATMIVAVLYHAVGSGHPFISNGGPSYEMAALYLTIAVLFVLSGAGKFSVDRKLFK